MAHVETTSVPQILSKKILTDVFMGNDFESQSALAETITLTASTVFTYPNLLEIGPTVSLEIPSTSSLEIEAYVDQAYVNNTVGTVPDAGNTFMAEKLIQSVMLPPVNDFLVEELLEIGVGVSLEIPSTSSLEVLTYQPSMNLAQYKFASESGTITSSSYGDLTGATIGPAVSVTIGARGMALVSFDADSAQSTAGDYCAISMTISGATTLAAGAPHESFFQAPSGAGNMRLTYTCIYTGLTPGVNTFTMKYKIITGGTGTYINRQISVMSL